MHFVGDTMQFWEGQQCSLGGHNALFFLGGGGYNELSERTLERGICTPGGAVMHFGTLGRYAAWIWP